MAWRDWEPPRWLVWNGLTWAGVLGIPAQVPPWMLSHKAGVADPLTADLDEELARLLADGVGH